MSVEERSVIKGVKASSLCCSVPITSSHILKMGERPVLCSANDKYLKPQTNADNARADEAYFFRADMSALGVVPKL